MKSLLYVNCCLRSGSRTQRLAEAYLNAMPRSDTQIREIRLSELSLLPLDEAALLRRDQHISAGQLDDPAYSAAREFAAADEILIAAPYWDASFPARLKIYFENICVNGITFAYGDNGTMVRKCRAERLTYLTTAGGFLGKDPSVKACLQELCSLFSIPEFRFYSAEGLDAFPDRVESLLEQTCEKLLSELRA